MRFYKLTIIFTFLVVCSAAPLSAQTAERQASMADIKGSVNSHNGTYGTSIPIQVPEYFGIEPEVAISYSAENDDGDLGVGWGLSVTSGIKRVSALKGQANYDNTDIYLLDGMELIPCARQTAVPASPSCLHGGTHSTKIENFNRIKYIAGANGTDKWQIWDSSGTLAELKSIRTFNPGSGVVTSEWGTSTITDLYNHVVNYDYQYNMFGGTNIKLSAIRYNNDKYKVKFHYKDIVYSFSPRRIRGDSGIMDDDRGVLIAISVHATDESGEKVVRSYSFDYEKTYDERINVNQGNRPLLRSVKLSGTDSTQMGDGTWSSASQVTIASFDYEKPDKVFQSSGFNMKFNGALISYGTDDTFFHVQGIAPSVSSDINGDGIADLIRSARVTYNNTLAAGGWREAKGVFITQKGGQNYRMGELIDDPAWALPNGIVLTELQLTAAANPPSWYSDKVPNAKAVQLGQFADLNGDGKPDLVHKNGKYLNTGRGWAATASWATPGTYKNDQYYDINGDGYADIIRATKISATDKISEVYLNTGTSFVKSTVWNLPAEYYLVNELTTDAYPRNANLIDINNDGLLDIYKGGTIYLNSGRGFQTQNAIYAGDLGKDYTSYWLKLSDSGPGLLQMYCGSAGLPSKLNISSSIRLSACFKDGVNVTGDFNGDGYTDILNTANRDSLLSQNKPYLLKQVGSSLGGFETITYNKSSQLDNSFKCNANGTPNAAGTYACQGMPQTKWVVSQITSDTNSNSHKNVYTRTDPVSTVSYDFSGGLYDGKERVFLGFRYVKETLSGTPGDPQPPIRETWYKMAEGTITKPERSDFSAFSKTANRRVLYSSEVGVYLTNGNQIPRKSQIQYDWSYTYDGSGAVCNFTEAATPCANGFRKREDYTYDQFGNVLTALNYGDFDRSGDEFIGVTKFTVNPTKHILNLPYETQTKTHPSLTLLDHVVTYYDGSSTLGGMPTLGNPTKKGQWLNTLNNNVGGFIYTTSLFNVHGMIDTSTDGDNRSTKYIYDTVNGFMLAETRNPLLHTTKTKWNYLCGAPKESINENNQSTSLTYDMFCRPLKITRPNGGTEEWEYNLGPYVLSNVKHKVNNVETYSYVDGIGRTKKTSSSTAGNVHIFYNTQGNVSQVSAPNNKEWYQVTYTQMEYDAIGRVTKKINPDGSFSTSTYTHNSRHTIDEEGGEIFELSDINGRVIEQREKNSKNEWVTKTFKYNAKGEQYEIRDNKNNVWSMTYDSLGRRTRFVDPDSGVITSEYDNSGNLKKQISNSGSVTFYEYDQLSRIIRKYTDYGTANQKVYVRTYDQGRAGYYNIGMLTSATFPGGSKILNYGKEGQLVHQSKTIGTATYSLSNAYLPNGSISSTTYPDGTVVNYQYNYDGRLDSVPGYIDFITYRPEDGKVANLRNANLSDITYKYDNNMGWLTNLDIFTPREAYMPVKMTYQRDKLGRIKNIQGEARSKFPGTWTYAYDKLGQMTLAAGGGLTENFMYDDLGNITSMVKNGVSSNYHYGANSYSALPGGALADWKDNFGSTPPSTCVPVSGDYDGNGLVDGNDFLLWQRGATPIPRNCINMNMNKTLAAIPACGVIEGDYNNDRKVDSLDLQLMQQGAAPVYRACPVENWNIDCTAYQNLSKIPPMPHAVHKAGFDKYCYDFDGRMIRDSSGRKIVYDGGGKPIQAGGETYMYDEDGSRVQKVGTETIHYPFGDAYEVNVTTGVHTLYVSAAGQTIKKVGANKYWLHQDHQGSIRLVTDGTGAIVYTMSYEAYGEKRAIANTHKESLGFTGQRHDANGLVYLHARYYNPKINRFMSPDATVPTSKMLGLNRYVYAENDPINKEDISGYGAGYSGGYMGRLGGAIAGGIRSVGTSIGRAVGYGSSWIQGNMTNSYMGTNLLRPSLTFPIIEDAKYNKPNKFDAFNVANSNWSLISERKLSKGTGSLMNTRFATTGQNSYLLTPQGSVYSHSNVLKYSDGSVAQIRYAIGAETGDSEYHVYNTFSNGRTLGRISQGKTPGGFFGSNADMRYFRSLPLYDPARTISGFRNANPLAYARTVGGYAGYGARSLISGADEAAYAYGTLKLVGGGSAGLGARVALGTAGRAVVASGPAAAITATAAGSWAAGRGVDYATGNRLSGGLATGFWLGWDTLSGTASSIYNMENRYDYGRTSQAWEYTGKVDSFTGF